MLSFFILVVVSLLPFISTWITSPQEIFLEESRFKKSQPIFKRQTSWKLTRKGWYFLGIAVLSIFFAWVQYNENQKSTNDLKIQLATRDSINRTELRIRDQQARKEQSVRDSVNNEKLRKRDSIANLQLYKRDSFANVRIEKGKNETIVALGKYSLRYDSSQQFIEKLIRDSSKTKVIAQSDPILNLCSDKAIEFHDSAGKVNKFKAYFCSKEAASRDFNITLYVGYTPSLEKFSYTYFGKYEALSPHSSMSSDEQIISYFDVPNTINAVLIFVLIKGTYTNADRSKLFDVNSLFFYNAKTKRSGILKGDTERNIRYFIQKKAG